MNSTLFPIQNGAVRVIELTDRLIWAASQQRTDVVASTIISAHSTSWLGPRNSVFTIAALIQLCIALATIGKFLMPHHQIERRNGVILFRCRLLKDKTKPERVILIKDIGGVNLVWYAN